MASFVILGMVLGVLLAYAATKPLKKFRKRLAEDYESHARQGVGTEFITRVTRDKRAWIRSVSIIRKPFSTEINLAVETIAFILACVGVVNSFVNFDRYFKSSLEGETVLVFLGAVLAFIPFQWLLNICIDRHIEAVFAELKRALLAGRIEEYMAEATKNWK